MATNTTTEFHRLNVTEIEAAKPESDDEAYEATVVVIEDGQQFFRNPASDPAVALARVTEAISWTDWKKKVGGRLFAQPLGGGLVIGFPTIDHFQTGHGSVELVTARSFGLAGLIQHYQMNVRLHNLHKKPDLDFNSQTGGEPVSVDFVFNRPSPIFSYFQMFNRTLYENFGLIFRVANMHFAMPSEGLTQGFVVRDEAVRTPQIGQVILLELDDDDTVQATAYKLTKLSDLEQSSGAQEESPSGSQLEAVRAFRDQHGD